MSDLPITFEHQRELIERLLSLSARRVSEGGAASERDRARAAEHRREFLAAREERLAAFRVTHAAKIAEYHAAREATLASYDVEANRYAVQEKEIAAKAAQEMADSIADAKALRQHRTREILKTHREQKSVPKKEQLIFEQRCRASAEELHTLVLKAQEVMRRRGAESEGDFGSVPVPPHLSQQDYLNQYRTALAKAIDRLDALQNQPAAKFVEDGWPFLNSFLVALVLIIATPFFLNGWQVILAVTIVSALVAGIGSWLVARPYAQRQTRQIVPELMAAVSEAHSSLAAARDAAKQTEIDATQKIVAKRDADLAETKAEYKRRRKEAKVGYLSATKRGEQEFVSRRQKIEARFEGKFAELDRQFPAEIEKIEQSFKQQLEELRQRYLKQLQDSRAQRDRELGDLTAMWTSLIAEVNQATDAMNGYCERHCQTWPAIASTDWQPKLRPNKANATKIDGESTGAISALPIGHFDVALPTNDRVTGERSQYSLPAVLEFPSRPSLLLEGEGTGRDAATVVLQNVMLRLLTTLPPGKVRFTIIDPVGLGQNFSAFMHLADYDDKLVGNRIWTESAHINQKLADLTQHMENVIQKYLRNEFASIQEYNEQAGEVAEPFQVLVVANFPANFSDEAARRLAAIATSGGRCGVSMLVSTDSKLSLPRNFDLNDLASQAVTLKWNEETQRFGWKDEALSRLPLTLEKPPEDAEFTQIVKKVGAVAKDASRVEVPFETIMPRPGEWWTGDSRGGIDVPLGRAGAKNLQTMRLGRGTSQHVLISGKTGSGKSTLLNALITNLSLCYSPEELEFYLIDFKKGVEFKAYAALGLPHARVIAIESEREFGMSVLERLDQELKRRGDLFRKAGVQDLKAYRNSLPPSTDDTPMPPMPRVLLIIDEFQEFFTSDDRIAHDAALLLDRLVRQGRAFGIHVLLGSQTLAGAYSLARSTLGQMAVRIALQCSEADAHLILSEDNTAARLLGRPGEAIYNDANGLIEGNHPFQVVWLSDSEREEHLRRVAKMASERHVAVPKPIVFEGNAAADPAENTLLGAALQTAGQPAPPRDGVRSWLGAAVSIKDPTDATFRSQSGSNLLVVGQNDEQAIGMLSVGVISLAAQLGPIGGAASLVARGENSPARLQRFYILDGTRPEAAEAGYWQRMLHTTGVDGSVVQPREATQLIGDLADEVNRRLAAGEQGAEPVFLVIYNLARFRDLKKGDDYSFDDDEGAAAGKKLATILREGPSVGVHALVWCDSYNNATRWLDRQALRDFEMRVLFQMSAADSSNLMDSAAASKLGNYTAMFYSDERGVAEKFRPYGLPSKEWLNWVAEKLRESDGTVAHVTGA